MLSLGFFINSISFGVALAMDAFSMSLANGLNEKKMKKSRMCTVAGVYTFFQFAMPLIGWICVHTILSCFTEFEKLIPYIALALLGYIGGKMLCEGIRGEDCGCGEGGSCLSFGTLILQGIATSIDALSVGLDIGSYTLFESLVCCSLIAAVTFIICMGGLVIGKKFGTKLAGKASVLGGMILIAIGLKIFIEGVFLH